MKKLYSMILKNMGILVLGVVLLSANTTSNFAVHQPKVPQGIKKYKKI
ncbi:cyclic lactone autoinducer peptide [Clostridium sp. CCUG 7971]|nr:cyclic lactone autoinducer peptide [Clostridium sp. CCUG 7971]MBO3443791.1 cyclic lactone autoinducer peptide [Clostridium sp. CCUG 7971]